MRSALRTGGGSSGIDRNLRSSNSFCENHWLGSDSASMETEQQKITATRLITEDSVIVVAHPDDEVLWFSSLARTAAKVLVCFFDASHAPLIGAARRRAIDNHPLSNLKGLNLPSPGIPGYANWRNPVATSYGFRIPYWQRSLRKSYMRTDKLLREVLQDELRGFRSVITHNPWGEYGNEHHVMVFRAIEHFQSEFQYCLWCSTYFSSRTAAYTGSWLSRFNPSFVARPTDQDLGKKAMAEYAAENCWTWSPAWTWPDYEAFIQLAATETSENPTHLRSAIPMNFITKK